MASQGQALLRKFYDDFGIRIAFIREKLGMGLGALAGGSPSTAKSWESGSVPSPAKWGAIAERVGLSASFVFMGEPRSQADYDFVAKYGDEIGPPPAAKTLHANATPSTDPDSPPREASGADEVVILEQFEITGSRLRKLEDPASTRALTSQIQAKMKELVAAAAGDPSKLGWINEQLAMYLALPKHWQAKVSAAVDTSAALAALRAGKAAVDAQHEAIQREHPLRPAKTG